MAKRLWGRTARYKMTDYYIGDIHGCYLEFTKILKKLKITKDDQVYLAGDLVNRGPESLETLKLAKQENYKMVLGNHDLYLLACYFKAIPKEYTHTFHRVIADDDCDAIMEWLMQQPLYHFNKKDNFLLVHAGLYPFWTLEQAMELADEAKSFMQQNPQEFFSGMFGQDPCAWQDAKTRLDRHRFIINAFTRMRYVNMNGELDFTSHKPPPHPNKNLQPWYKLLPESDLKVAFGHWSAIGGYKQSQRIIALDGGCVWGEKLLSWNRQEDKWQLVKCIKG